MGFLSNLFGRKKDESVDLTDAGPLGRSLRRCKKCDALCLMVGSGSFIFSSGRSTKKHDHEWVLTSEQRVIDTQYNSDDASYLKGVDDMFEGLQGLLERSSQARSIRIEVLERVAELTEMIPSEPVKAHRYKAGVICGQACAFDLAAKELEKAVKLAPENTDDRNQMAIYYFLSDNWERAQQVWEDILQSAPEYGDAAEQYTAALTQKFNESRTAEERVSYSKKLVELHPKSQRYNRDLGVCYQDASKWKEAITHLELAIRYATEPLGSTSVASFRAELKDRIAFCYSKLGMHTEAAKYWEEALKEKDWPRSERSQILADLEKAKAKLAPGAAPAPPPLPKVDPSIIGKATHFLVIFASPGPVNTDDEMRQLLPYLAQANKLELAPNFKKQVLVEAFDDPSTYDTDKLVDAMKEWLTEEGASWSSIKTVYINAHGKRFKGVVAAWAKA